MTRNRLADLTDEQVRQRLARLGEDDERHRQAGIGLSREYEELKREERRRAKAQLAELTDAELAAQLQLGMDQVLEDYVRDEIAIRKRRRSVGGDRRVRPHRDTPTDDLVALATRWHSAPVDLLPHAVKVLSNEMRRRIEMLKREAYRLDVLARQLRDRRTTTVVPPSPLAIADGEGER